MKPIYGWGLPVAASSYAGQIDWGIWLIHLVMIAMFVLWGIFFAYLLLKYRARPGVGAQREEQHSLKGLIPDFVVAALELALIVFYAVPVWSRIKQVFPSEDSAHRVDVIAEQFAWNIHHPGPDGKFGARKPELVHFSNPIGLDHDDPAAADDIVLANELHLPLDKATLIRLSSKDVIHSFFVPEFRIKQDALPGLVIPVWVQPTLPGKFEISCAQLCGFAHSLMRGDVFVHAPDEYERWLKAHLPAQPEKGSNTW